MTLRITDLAPSVYVGLTSTPYTAPGSVTWTDLSSRVITCETSSDSRDDRTAEFSAGSATVVLDNSDRLLDPTYSSSLVYGSNGLPGCPVKIMANGSNVWYGVLTLSGECWQVNRTRGAASTCTMNAVTLTSFVASLAMPSSPWAAGIITMDPDWWVRGDASTTALVSGNHIPDTISGGTLYATATGNVNQATSLVANDQNPALAPQSGAYIKSAAASLDSGWPSVNRTSFTASTIWKNPTITSGPWNVMSLYYATGTHYRFQVTADSVGQLILTMYDGAGTAVTYATAPANPSDTGGRWDDDQAHIVTVKYTGGSKLALWVDGQHVDITSSVPASYGQADLQVGTINGSSTVDEILWWNSTLSDADILTMHGWFLGTAAPLARQTPADRVTSLASLAGWSGTITDHFSSSDPSLWGLGSVKAMPQSFGEALSQVADSLGGAWWASRSGSFRIRSAAALSDGSFAAYYATVQGNLTDEQSPAGSPTPIRRGLVQKTGTRSDRLVTRATVTFGADGGLGVPSDTLVQTTTEASSSVKALYGVKPVEIETQAIVSSTYAADLASSALLTTPPVEVQPVTIDVIDQATFDWCTGGPLGLEKMVTVTDTAAVGGVWTANLNVQGETFTWDDDGSLTVTLSLAASRVKTGRAKVASSDASKGVIVSGTGIAAGSVTVDKLSPTLKSSLGLAATTTSTGITALTGDVTASGTGSVAATVTGASGDFAVTGKTTFTGKWVETAATQAISSASDTIPITASAVACTGSTDVVLTSVDTMPAGTTGQRIVVGYISSSGSVTLQDATASGIATRLELSGPSVTLRQGDTIEFIYSGTVGKWRQIGTSKSPVMDSSGQVVQARLAPPPGMTKPFRAVGAALARQSSQLIVDAWITDSFGFLGTSAGETKVASAVYEAQLSRRTSGFMPVKEPNATSTGVEVQWDTVGGTTSVSYGFAWQSAVSMTGSQYSEVTRYGDGVEIFYTAQRTGGATATVTINGTTVGTINSTDSAVPASPGYDCGRKVSYANPAGTVGPMTIRVTTDATANTFILEAARITSQNRTTGFCVHKGGRSGWTLGDINDNVPLQQHLANNMPQIVTIAAGTNDFAGGSFAPYTAAATATTYASRLASVFATIRNCYKFPLAVIDTAADTVAPVGGNKFVNGQIITLSSIVTSTGITASQRYYVINAGSTTFQLSTTSGGSAVNITGSNGTCTVNAQPPAIRYCFQPAGGSRSTTPDATWLTVWRNTARQVCESDGDVAFIDWSEVTGVYGPAAVGGDPLGIADLDTTSTLHPGDVGQAMLARTVLDATVTPGAYYDPNSGGPDGYSDIPASGIRGYTGVTSAPTVLLRRISAAGGSATSPVAISTEQIGAYAFQAYNTASKSVYIGAQVTASAEEAWSTALYRGAGLRFWTAPTASGTAAVVRAGINAAGTLFVGPTLGSAVFSVTSAGLVTVSNKISGLTAGTASTDAVNVGQALLIDGTTNTSTSGAGAIPVNSTTAAPLFQVGYDRGAATTTGQILSTYSFRGSSDASSTMKSGAAVRGVGDGTWTNSSSPGRLEFSTTPSASTTNAVVGGFDSAGVFFVGTNASRVFTVSAAGAITATGALAMGTNKITGLGNGTASTDAAAYGQIDNPLYVKSAEVSTNGTPARTLGTYSVTGSTVNDGDQLVAKFALTTSSGISSRTVTINVTFDGTSVSTFTLSGASASAIATLTIVRNSGDAKCMLEWTGNAVTASALYAKITPANWTSARVIAITGANSTGSAADATLTEMTVRRVIGIAPS